MCRNQRGAALITALLTAALVSILAVALISRQEMDIRRTATVIHGDQAELYARGVESWATYLIDRGVKNSLNQNEYLGRQLPPMPVEGGHVTGRADDLQGLFNLNNLVLGNQAYYPEQFKRLLRGCAMSDDLVYAVIDWLDADQVPAGFGGAEDLEYQSQPVPYRTADRIMTSASELDLVRGFTGEAYEKCLRPLVTALPERTLLNVNTAPARLIASLSGNISLPTAEQVVAGRPAAGFKDLDEFLQLPALTAAQIDRDFIRADSEFFVLQSEAAIGQNLVTFYSLFQLRNNTVQVLRRSMGRL